MRIANSNNINLKSKVLSLIAPTLQILEKHETTNSITTPSFFTIQTIFKFYQINLNNEEADWNSEKCYNLDKQMANLLLKTRKQIESQKLHLEKPKTLLKFYEVLSFQLIQFFEGMIQTLLERLYNQANERQQKRQKNYNSKNLNTKKVQKTVIFMVSIIVSLAFKKTKIWLTRILSSLCQKSHLISSFYKVLLSVNAISHTKR